MQYLVKHTQSAQQKTDCLIVGVFTGQQLSEAAEALDKQSNGYLKTYLKQGHLKEECGNTALLYAVPKLKAQQVLLVACGKAEELNETNFRKIIARATAAVKTLNVKEITNYLTDLSVKNRATAWKIRQAVEINFDGFYQFIHYKSDKKIPKPATQKIIFNVEKPSEIKMASKALKEAVAITDGMQLTKDLGNTPANVCTPTYLAAQATKLAKAYKKLKIKIFEKKDMQKMGMGALLAVAQGSAQPPKLIVLQYNGAKKNKRPVVLVGKGITFDSGGISLKPAPGMEEMKYDMCGAASVLGTLKACAELQLPLNVVGVIPTTENLPDGGAVKPGDVVTTFSGQTIEILNTDAEGRLILSDALGFSERFNPAVVIDIATLTGAIITALGSQASGLMGNNETLLRDLKKAGDESFDRVWELPLWEEYQELITSNVADIANISAGMDAKSITAGCFLSRFTRKFHWAHLDVAGTASLRGAREKNATGRPVPLLVQYLLDKNLSFS